WIVLLDDRLQCSVHTTGVAVLRFGLKNGVFTTVARTWCLTASTVISNCRREPGRVYSRFTVASAIIRFNVGDHVVVVALPTWIPSLNTGTATRDAIGETAGGKPTAS